MVVEVEGFLEPPRSGRIVVVWRLGNSSSMGVGSLRLSSVLSSWAMGANVAVFSVVLVVAERADGVRRTLGRGVVGCG